MRYDHDCDLAPVCPVCGCCLQCGPHAPGEWVEVRGRTTIAGPCRDAMLLGMLDRLDIVERMLTEMLDSPVVSPRTRRKGEALAEQLAADRDSILGTGGL